MRSSLSTKTSSQMTPSQQRLFTRKRVWALSCAAVGGVGILWLPGVAQMGGIVPEQGANQAPVVAPLPEMSPLPQTPSVPAVPATTSRMRAAATQQESRISIEMRDAPVIDLLMLIAAQGGVDISIGSDVEATLKIPGIRLTDVTPAEAIRKAAETASLQWKKIGDKSYLVGKVLRDGSNSSSTGSDSGIRAIEPIDNGWLNAPKLPSGSLSVLPQYGNNGGGTPSDSLVPLNMRPERKDRKIVPIKIRNVRSGLMAWWLDPKHQELPIELQASELAKKRAINPYPLMPGVDPNVMSTINGNAPAGMPFMNPYAVNNALYNNPYMNAGATHPWLQPSYRSSFLFGGGGGGGGGFGGGGAGGGFGGGMLELGTNAQGDQEVDQIVSIDAQNVLLVYGTDEGIRQLNEIIDFLDRPIRQVEIESQFIDISVNDAKAFGLQFYNRSFLQEDDDDNNNDDDNPQPTNALGVLPGVTGASTLVFTKGMFQARLQALAQSGRARIINSPRVTTMNNLTASLVSQQQTPVVLTSSDTGIGGQVGETQNAFFLTTAIGIQVTPTIQNDDTITVFLTPQVSVQSQTPTFGGGGGDDDDDDNNNNAASSIPTVSSQFVTTVANVKDNDVIVLGGLRTRTQNIVRSRVPILSKLPLIGRLFRSTNTTDVDRELVIFLTARILRRSDDVTPIQGP